MKNRSSYLVFILVFIIGFSGTIFIMKNNDHIECERCRKYFEEKDIVKISLEEEHNICVTCNEIIK